MNHVFYILIASFVALSLAGPADCAKTEKTGRPAATGEKGQAKDKAGKGKKNDSVHGSALYTKDCAKCHSKKKAPPIHPGMKTASEWVDYFASQVHPNKGWKNIPVEDLIKTLEYFIQQASDTTGPKTCI